MQAQRELIGHVHGIQDGFGARFTTVRGSRDMTISVHHSESSTCVETSLDAVGVRELRNALERWLYGNVSLLTLARDGNHTVGIEGIAHRGSAVEAAFGGHAEQEGVEVKLSVHNSHYDARYVVTLSASGARGVVGACNLFLNGLEA